MGRTVLLSTTRLACRVVAPIRPTQILMRNYGSSSYSSDDTKDLRKAKTPLGHLDDKWEAKNESMEPQKNQAEDPADRYAPFPDNKNPETGEIGGPKGPEPTRYGDWERKGRVIDF